MLKTGDPCGGKQHYSDITCMITYRIGLHSVLLPLQIILRIQKKVSSIRPHLRLMRSNYSERLIVVIAASYIGGERSELLVFQCLNNMAGTTYKRSQSTTVHMVLSSPEVYLNCVSSQLCSAILQAFSYFMLMRKPLIHLTSL